MTTARSRAIEALVAFDCGGDTLDECRTLAAEAVDALTAHVLSAAEGRPRPAPLSPEAKAARVPPPPETLVGALQDRIHVEDGRLLRSTPLATNAPAAPASSDGRPDREALGRKAFEAWCFAEGNAALPWGWKKAELGKKWEAWCVVGERLYEMGRKDGGGALNDERYQLFKGMQARAESAESIVYGLQSELTTLRDRVAVASRDRDAAVAHIEKLVEVFDDLTPCDDNCQASAILSWVDPADRDRVRELRCRIREERDAALARAEAAEKDHDYQRAEKTKAVARAEAAESRVRALEATFDRLERVPVSAEVRAMAADMGAADMRERAAKESDDYAAKAKSAIERNEHDPEVADRLSGMVEGARASARAIRALPLRASEREAETATLAAARASLAEAEAKRDDLRTELQNAVDRLASSDHVIREMQARERNMVADKREAERARDEAREALVQAEAALSDIGDATREPGDDLAWCERRAERALPIVRAALAKTEADTR